MVSGEKLFSLTIDEAVDADEHGGDKICGRRGVERLDGRTHVGVDDEGGTEREDQNQATTIKSMTVGPIKERNWPRRLPSWSPIKSKMRQVMRAIRSLIRPMWVRA